MRRLRLVHALLVGIALTACVDSDPAGLTGTRARAPQYAIPANWSGNIRIGVVPTATSITIGSAGDYTIRAKTSGAVLLSGNNGGASVVLTTPAVTKWYVQVACASAAGLPALIAKLEADGHPYVLEPIAACTRVLVGDFLLSQSFTIRNNFRLLLVSQGYDPGSFGTTRVVSVPTYKLTQGATVVNSTQPPVATSSTGIVTINGAPYRGAAEVIGNSAGGIAGVNELPIEQYLYGVVPRELGPVAFPEVEAQKAQAIAARTYALRGLGKRAADGYDLLATTSDQVYGGYAAEHPVSSAAVDATAGVALTFDGSLIDALYSSATGGHSADSEESFSTVIPYLRGVPDAERGEALEHVPSLEVFRSHANARSLRGAREGDFESDWSGRHTWTFEWSAQEISNVLSAWRGTPVGAVSAINVLQRGPSGRVLLIEYVTEAGTFTHARDAIRSSLRFIGAGNVLSNLPSTLFFIEPSPNREGAFVVHGAGFGHGVGLGQTGAVGMAEKGHSYEEILRHYYTGVDLAVMY
jgi:stage II sporulation protein D